MATPNTTNSIIGEKSYFEGRFQVKGLLHIDGKFEGEALEVEQLTVGPKGKVRTNIYANVVTVEGLIIGNIEAKIRVFLKPTSKVLGNIKTKELIIQGGVILEGNCMIGSNLKKSPKDMLVQLFNEGG